MAIDRAKAMADYEEFKVWIVEHDKEGLSGTSKRVVELVKNEVERLRKTIVGRTPKAK
jgi:hypothetical protein